jgi:hypothetical protein
MDRREYYSYRRILLLLPRIRGKSNQDLDLAQSNKTMGRRGRCSETKRTPRSRSGLACTALMQTFEFNESTLYREKVLRSRTSSKTKKGDGD